MPVVTYHRAKAVSVCQLRAQCNTKMAVSKADLMKTLKRSPKFSALPTLFHVASAENPSSQAIRVVIHLRLVSQKTTQACLLCRPSRQL